MKIALNVSDIDSSEYRLMTVSLCLTIHARGVLGFEVETQEDTFWAPIAHRMHKRLKLKTILCRLLSKTS